MVTLRKDPLVVICNPQHPFAKLKGIKLKALNGSKLVSFEKDIPTRKAIDKILRENSIEVQTVMEFDNIETVKRAVEIDAGISIVPEATITQELAKKTLAAAESIEVETRSCSEGELFEFDEVLMLGTGVEIVPITAVNGRKIRDGYPGPVTKRLQNAFRLLVGT
jgi:ribosomal protein L21